MQLTVQAMGSTSHAAFFTRLAQLTLLSQLKVSGQAAMQQLKDYSFRTPVSAFYSVPVYLTIFVLGLQYSYYTIFSSFPEFDDEGTMLLNFRAFFEDTHSYDLSELPYGPFYYLLRYAIYSILNSDVSHDTNRLMTTVFWGSIAALSAFFVHRVTRSLILAAVVQILLIFYLFALIGSTGHPQEIALLLIAAALLLSSYVGSQRYGPLSRVGLGACLGALLLVKINIGIYLGIPLALSMLLSLPRHTLVRCLLWLTSAVAVLLPTAMMWKHAVLLPLDRNYCIAVTLVIAACLITASRKDDDAQFQWSDVGITVSAMFLSMACIVGFIVAWGGSLQGIADQVLLRALKFPSIFHVTFPMPDIVVYASIASFLLALCYRFVILKIGNNESRVLTVSLVKLVYGCIVLFVFSGALRQFPFLLPLLVIPVPLLWIVLIEPYGDLKPALGNRFPRVFLCFLAAFQTLQAYPVAGAQIFWAVFLLIPLAMICIGDTLPIFGAEIKRCWPKKVSSDFRQRLYSTFMVVLICLVGVWSYHKANIGELEKIYSRLEPLDLPGASKIRLAKQDALNMRGLIKSIKSHCDGFVGLPGMPSLYFWTQIRPPGLVNDAWVNHLAENRQHEIIDNMEKYERPCVIYNPKREKFWLRGQPEDSKKPLVNYIQSQFTEIQKYGDFSLLTKNEHAIPVQ